MKHYIYKTTNLINQKYYIGKSSKEEVDPKYIGSGIAIKHAIKKHGMKNFILEIVEFNESKEANRIREIEIIGDLWKTDPMCYNMKPGGDGGSAKGKRKPGLTGENHFNFGKKLSDETKSKISASLIGSIISQETREKISKSNTGRKFDDAFKEKVSVMAQRKPFLCEHCGKSFNGGNYTQHQKALLKKQTQMASASESLHDGSQAVANSAA